MPKVSLYALLQLLSISTKTSLTGSVTGQSARFATQQVEPSRMEKST
jgi:hypothetical protein